MLVQCMLWKAKCECHGISIGNNIEIYTFGMSIDELDEGKSSLLSAH